MAAGFEQRRFDFLPPPLVTPPYDVSQLEPLLPELVEWVWVPTNRSGCISTDFDQQQSRPIVSAICARLLPVSRWRTEM